MKKATIWIDSISDEAMDEGQGSEIARILREAAERLPGLDNPFPRLPFHDMNGNKVGGISVSSTGLGDEGDSSPALSGEIEMENAAFNDQEAGELSRILNDLAQRIEGRDLESIDVPIFDQNGNRVGRFASTLDQSPEARGARLMDRMRDWQNSGAPDSISGDAQEFFDDLGVYALGYADDAGVLPGEFEYESEDGEVAIVIEDPDVLLSLIHWGADNGVCSDLQDAINLVDESDELMSSDSNHGPTP